RIVLHSDPTALRHRPDRSVRDLRMRIPAPSQKTGCPVSEAAGVAVRTSERSLLPMVTSQAILLRLVSLPLRFCFAHPDADRNLGWQRNREDATRVGDQLAHLLAIDFNFIRPTGL